MAHLSIRVLGPFQAHLNGEPVTGFASDKVRALLVYLALSPDRPHRREVLAGLLWPEFPERSARTNLRNTLAKLRHVLGEQARSHDRDASPPFLQSTRQTIQFNGQSDYWLDVDAFEDLVANAQPASDRLEQAVSLVHGDFLEGFTLADAAPFEEWLLLRREYYGRRVVEALGSLVAIYEKQGAHDLALIHARRRVELEPWQEEGQRQLMRLLARSGRRSQALAQYEALCRSLRDEIGAEPSADTAALHLAIQSGDLQRDAVAQPGPPAPVWKLPSLPTSFVGREAELAEIARRLQDPDCRLLTLVGPGGVGKSRLAIEAAAAQLDLSPSLYPHGACFVPLAPVVSDELVVPTIAAALGFSFHAREGEDPKQQLFNYLREKQMLLLLDNFEQLLDSAGLLSELLESAPSLKLLVTSRERLNLQREWLFRVQGLRYPGVAPVKSLEGYSALALFLGRASQVDPGFAIPQAELADLIRICRLVEGLPLGLELAAAWVKMLSCREIADEIERSLDFLSTTARDVPERHRSLRAVCDRSWALLSEEERNAFKRLAVFQGGFQREAAVKIAGASLPLLSSLIDKSLVRCGRPGWYEVHEVLHQYGLEKLAQVPGQESRVRGRHSTYFTGLLQRSEAALKGAGQPEALEQIGASLQDVRAAWSWAIAHGKVAEIRKAATSLWLYYEMHSLLEEGEQAFAQAVARLEAQEGRGAEDDVTLGLLLALQGRLAGRRYRFQEAARSLRRSQALLRQQGAQRELALANSLSFFPGAEDCFPDLETLLQESLALHRGLGDRWGVAFALSRFHWTTRQLSDARRYLQESLAIGREIGDRWTVGLCLFQMGQVAQGAGATREAKQYFLQSEEVFRELGDRCAEQMSLDYAGYVARELGEYEEARRCHLESLRISREEGDRLGTAGSLNNLGLVAYDVGDHDEAERFLQEGLAIREAVGNKWAISISLMHLGDVALARGHHREACRRYKESLKIGQGDLSLRSEAVKRLGELSLAEGDLQQARQHFRETLEPAMRGQLASVPWVLETLVGIAQLVASMGKHQESAAWLTFILDHDASGAETRKRAQRLLKEMASRLPPQSMAEARGSSRDWTLAGVLHSVNTFLEAGSFQEGRRQEDEGSETFLEARKLPGK